MGLAMLAGRFWMIVPVLAIAGALAGKRVSPPGPGTFPTNGVLFEPGPLRYALFAGIALVVLGFIVMRALTKIDV